MYVKLVLISAVILFVAWKLAQYKDWYANGVPANMDSERKAQWEESRKGRREEERAAERAAGNSD